MTTAIDPKVFNVTVDYDHMGRIYAIIPDDIAHRLNVAVRANWKHYGWMGESELFPADHWVSQVAHTILAAVEEYAVEDFERSAARYGSFSGFIVGERGWDRAAKWWRNYQQNRAYQLDGGIVRVGGKIRFSN